MSGSPNKIGVISASRRDPLVQIQASWQAAPVVVLTREPALTYLGETAIAPITRTIREIPSEVILTVEDGMPTECAVNLDHVQTISKSRLGGLITTLNEDRMKSIRRALLFALGF